MRDAAPCINHIFQGPERAISGVASTAPMAAASFTATLRRQLTEHGASMDVAWERMRRQETLKRRESDRYGPCHHFARIAASLLTPTSFVQACGEGGKSHDVEGL
eukprot:1391798-Amorphochlora_amoeboformis.AAC.1